MDGPESSFVASEFYREYTDGRRGVGEFYMPGGAMDVSNQMARSMYMFAIKEYALEVMQDLEQLFEPYSLATQERNSDGGFPKCVFSMCLLAAESGSQLEQVRGKNPSMGAFLDGFLNWANTHHIEHWIWREAIYALEHRAKKVETDKFGCHFGNPFLSQALPDIDNDVIFHVDRYGPMTRKARQWAEGELGPRLVLDFEAWGPTQDSRKRYRQYVEGKFKLALKQYLDGIEVDMIDEGYKKTIEIREPDHYRIAVGWRILGKNRTQLAKEFDISPEAVTTAIRSVEKALGVEPFIGVPGRPTKAALKKIRKKSD